MKYLNKKVTIKKEFNISFRWILFTSLKIRPKTRFHNNDYIKHYYENKPFFRKFYGIVKEEIFKSDGEHLVKVEFFIEGVFPNKEHIGNPQHLEIIS